MRGIVTPEMFDCVPEINFETGYRYFLGNMDNYTNALVSIFKSIKSKLPILLSMEATYEYEGLRTITQTLRKMLGNIGATDIAETSYQLEQALLNYDLPYLRKHLRFFIIDLSLLTDHLEELLKKMEAAYSEKSEFENSSFLHYDFTKTKESIKLSSGLLKRKII